MACLPSILIRRKRLDVQLYSRDESRYLASSFKNHCHCISLESSVRKINVLTTMTMMINPRLNLTFHILTTIYDGAFLVAYPSYSVIQR